MHAAGTVLEYSPTVAIGTLRIREGKWKPARLMRHDCIRRVVPGREARVRSGCNLLRLGTLKAPRCSTVRDHETSTVYCKNPRRVLNNWASESRHGLCGATISAVSYQVVRPERAQAAGNLCYKYYIYYPWVYYGSTEIRFSFYGKFPGNVFDYDLLLRAREPIPSQSSAKTPAPGSRRNVI